MTRRSVPRGANAPNLEERFWSRVSKGATPDDCWEWTGFITPQGYGSISRNGAKTSAQRVAHELLIGPIPDGLVVDHLCRNRSCVNPAHLEAVTQKENIRRGLVWKTHCKYGHELTPENTITVKGGQSRACKECNRRLARETSRRNTAARRRYLAALERIAAGEPNAEQIAREAIA